LANDAVGIGSQSAQRFVQVALADHHQIGLLLEGGMMNGFGGLPASHANARRYERFFLQLAPIYSRACSAM
jgi:hypothetical protein